MGVPELITSRRAVLGLGLGAAAAATGALSGCSRFGVGGDSGTGGDGTSTINMIWWGDAARAEATNAMLDIYRKDQPDVTIKTEYQDSGPYQDKMATRFAAGDIPDLMCQRRDGIREYVDRKSLLDLNEHLDVLKLDDVPKNYPLGKVGDQLFGIPAGLNASGFVINIDVADKYGVEIPDGNTWSWDDLWAFSQAITKAAKSDGQEMYGVDFPFAEVDALRVYLRQIGESLYTPEDTFGASEKSLTEWFAMSVDQRKKGGLPPAGFIEEAGASSDESPIAAGLIAAEMIPTNNLKAYSESVDSELELNRMPGEVQGVARGMEIGVSMYWSIGAEAPNVDGGLDLMNFIINSIDGNKAVGPTRGLPVSTVVSDGIFDSLGPEDQRSLEYMTALAKEDLPETLPDPPGCTEVQDVLETVNTEVMFGRMTPADAAKQVITQAGEALGRVDRRAVDKIIGGAVVTAVKSEPATSSAVGDTRAAVSRRRRRRVDPAGYVFLLPWFVGMLFTIVPFGASLVLGFTDYDLLSAPEWVGLDNFVQLFHDPRVSQSLIVTFTYTFVSVPLSLIAALGVALALNRGMRGLPLYRAVYYLPSLLGSSVAVVMLWRQIFGTRGVVNTALGFFGIEGPAWVSDPSTALSVLIMLNIWTFGSPMVIFLAALRQVPMMYYESAAVDGASRWQQFRAITLPLISPIIFFNLVLSIIGSLQTFTQGYVMSGGSGGPAQSTLFYNLNLYIEGFSRFNMGYASAMAWLLLVIIAALTAINFLAQRFWVYYEN